ncbi:hypothetical protein ACHWQZ_G012597 [Mnemiopsis leidyi]
MRKVFQLFVLALSSHTVYSATCSIDAIYATYLNVVPLPNGNKLSENGTYFITCKNYGETFVNKVYDLEGVTEEAVYNTGVIEITCQYNGTIYPDFFNETYNWCRRGCARIPETSYTLKYPDGTKRTDEMLTPVAPTDNEILLQCAPGYVQAVGDNGNQKVKCDGSGSYNKYLINCVAGCDYPIDTSDGSTLSDIPSYLVGTPPFPTGTKVKVDCRGSTSSKEIICRPDLGWEGLDGLNCKRNFISLLGISANSSTRLFSHLTKILLLPILLIFIK